MVAPVKYYRVQDNSSATHFNEEDGFIAGDPELQLRMFTPRNPSEVRNLFNALDSHLDLSDTTPSPFISVYTNVKTAVNSAIARVKDGKKGVFIAYIDVEDIGGLYYRQVRKVAEEIGLWIQPRAWGNSQEEFIFLHHLPAEAITKSRVF